MGWFVRLLGILWIIIGIFGILATKRINLAISNLIINTRQKTLGLISLIAGVLLLLAAASVREGWFVFMLGIISCLKGLSVVLMPAKGLKAVIDWWLAAPEIVHKGWAITALILGVVMFYIV